MIPKDIAQITESDVLDFYKNNRGEGPTFDYKAELGDLGAKAQDKNELLKDITSFANAEGGDLIIGIDQKGEKVDGAKIDNEDGLLSQLEQIMLHNITPRLPTHPQIQFVPLINGNKYLIIRVGKSYIGPHRIYKEGKDFWSRGINGKFSLDVPQLRRMFVGREQAREDIQEFITSRTMQILSGNTPISISSSDPLMIMHFIPIQSYTENTRIDFGVMRDNAPSLVALESDARETTLINFDGLVKYNTFGNEIVSYSQAFYSGAIESVATKLFAQVLPVSGHDTELTFIADRFAETLFSDLPRIFKYLDDIGVQYPLMMHLQLHNVKGVKFVWRWPPHSLATYPELRNSALVFPEIMLQQRPELIAKELRPWLDLIWRAFGFEGCRNYNHDGSYAQAPGPGHQGRKWL